jgi:hypothetical protein
VRETPQQACTRLVVALEKLVADEAACVRNDDFAAVRALQQRAAPLITQISALATQVSEAAIKNRVNELIRRRSETAAQISTRLEEVRAKLDRVNATQRNATKVGAGYAGAARSAVPRSRFTATG